MSTAGVKTAIARLISDPDFKKAFKSDPKVALKYAGITLSARELMALKKLKPNDLSVAVKRPGPGTVGKIVVSKVTT